MNKPTAFRAITSLITRFYASATRRQVYAVVGPEGEALKAKRDSALARKGVPLAEVRDACHGDGAFQYAARQFISVGVARNGRGGTPTKQRTNVRRVGAIDLKRVSGAARHKALDLSAQRARAKRIVTRRDKTNSSIVWLGQRS